jgi:hypothetical protein
MNVGKQHPNKGSIAKQGMASKIKLIPETETQTTGCLLVIRSGDF